MTSVHDTTYVQLAKSVSYPTVICLKITIKGHGLFQTMLRLKEI